ncbi:InlB B-repeat-containing protein, partial [Parafannyhessea umbonata]
ASAVTGATDQWYDVIAHQYYTIDNRNNVHIVNGTPAYAYNATYYYTTPDGEGGEVIHGDTSTNNEILGDGSTVLRLYYVPGSFALTFDVNNGTWRITELEGYTLSDDGKRFVGQFKATTAITFPAIDPGSTPTNGSAAYRAGYALKGWMIGNDMSVIYKPGDAYSMPVGAVTFKAVWDALPQTYDVQHIKVRGDGTLETFIAKTNLETRVGRYAQEKESTPAGYDFVGDNQSYTYVDNHGVSQTVTTHANVEVVYGQATTLVLYYKPHTNTVFHVERYIITGDGQVVALDVDGSIVRDDDGVPTSAAAYQAERTGTTDSIAHADGRNGTSFEQNAKVYNDDILIEGYTFVLNGASYTISPGSGTTDASGNIDGDGSLILRLYWYADRVSALTYDLGDLASVSTMTDSTHRSDETFELKGKGDVSRTGYELVGWTTRQTVEVDGSDVTVSSARGETAFRLIDAIGVLNTQQGYNQIFFAQGATYQMPTHDITLYAVWKPIEVDYTIIRSKLTGNGDEVVLTTDVYSGLSDTELRFDATVAGYAGGITSATLNVVPSGYHYLAQGQTGSVGSHEVTTSAYGNIDPDGSSSFTLWYLPNTYKLMLEKGEGIWVSGTNPHAGTNHLTQELVELPLGEALDRPGYTFVGWSVHDSAASTTGSTNRTNAGTLSSDATGDWTSGGKHFTLPGTDFEMAYASEVGGTITLYAVWRANDISYYVDHYRVEGDGDIKEAWAETFTGIVDDDYTVTTTYSTASHDVNIRSGVSGDTRYNVAFVGYTFGSSFNVGMTSVESDTTLAIAVNAAGEGITHFSLFYKPDTLNLTFNAGLGVFTAGSTAGTNGLVWQRTTELSNIALPVDVKRDGYTFMGWSTDPACATAKGSTSRSEYLRISTLTGNDPAAGGAQWIASGVRYTMPTTSTTLYAVWRANTDTTFYVDLYRVDGNRVIKEEVLTESFTGITDDQYTIVTGDVQNDHQRKIFSSSESAAGNFPYNFIGYSYASSVSTTAGTKTTDVTLTILGYEVVDDATRFTIFYKADTIELEFDAGLGTFTSGAGANTNARVENHDVESTFKLPTNVQRAGYTLVGWSTSPSGKDKTGIASQTIAASLATVTGDAPDQGGANWTSVTSGVSADYVMPTTTQKLYAVWRANDTTTYYVERYVVTGDGVLVAIDKDGNLVRDAQGLVVPTNLTEGSGDAAHRVVHQGVTDEQAWADEAVSGVSYRNADNLAVAGYTLLGRSEAAYLGHATESRKPIAGDGSTVLVLIYQPNSHVITLEGGSDSNLGQTTIVEVLTDETIVLPSSTVAGGGEGTYARPGYTLKGWTTEQALDGIATNESTGLASRTMSQVIAGSAYASRSYDGGKVFSPVPASDVTPLSYVVPTSANITLYAVWEANADTAYTVEVVVVKGDGTTTTTVINHVGVTDEEAYADAALDDPDISKSWVNHDNTDKAGYAYYDDDELTPYVFQDNSNVTGSTNIHNGDEYTSVAHGNINGRIADALVLRLVYVPNLNFLDFVAGPSTAHWQITEPDAQYSTGTVIQLPGTADITRAGYDLVGWSIYSGANTSTGYASQSASTTISGQPVDDPANGMSFVVLGGSYTMPTASEVTLYAVWSARNDTAFDVEYFYVTGDVEVKTLKATETLYGTTDEVANVEASVENVTRNEWSKNDNVLGYTYVWQASPQTVVKGDLSYTAITKSHGTISAESKMMLTLYYVGRFNNIVFDTGLGAFDDGASHDGSYRSETTILLPVDIKRDGYTFMGWSTKPSYEVGTKPTSVCSSTGLASRDASALAVADGTSSVDLGVTFTAPGDSYVMGKAEHNTTHTITLYAVWSADTDTAYYVERYVVTGDGDLIALR